MCPLFLDTFFNIGKGLYQELTRKQERREDQLREDTSYQRTVADMRAAGLNPATLSGGTDGGAVSQGSTLMEPLDFDSKIQGYQQLEQNKESLEYQDKWQKDANGLKSIELGLMSDDIATREKSRQDLAWFQKQQAEDMAQERIRKDKEYKQKLLSDVKTELNNLITIGTTDGTTLNGSANFGLFGGSGETTLGDKWSTYGYDNADVTNMVNSRHSPDWISDKIKVKYRGNTPVFTYTDKNGDEYYYNPELNSWTSVKYSGVEITDKKPKTQGVQDDSDIVPNG